jgi:hypothetical protein
MTTHEGTRRITSLRELRRDASPGRDLWPAIAAKLKERSDARDARGGRVPWRGVLAVAATVAALAVGISLGRLSLRGATAPVLAARAPIADATLTLPAAYRPGERFRAEREQELRAAQARLAQLPPATRAKVAASLAVLEQSLHDIQAAIGKDPANALLQELLVNTYQDEMRVLVDLQTAGNAGQES